MADRSAHFTWHIAFIACSLFSTFAFDSSTDDNSETQRLLETLQYKEDRRNKLYAKDGFLSNVSFTSSKEHQAYDGWYNNPSQPSLGSADSPLIRLLPSAYDDSVKDPVTYDKANPLNISDVIHEGEILCESLNTAYSTSGRNVFMVFFGQFVVEEILHARKPSCPPEYFRIEIPNGHFYSYYTKMKEMPFVRTAHDKRSGRSSNNPRRQLNSATAWIDGSVIYGTKKSIADSLRFFKGGLLSENKIDPLFPAFNYEYLYFLNPAVDHKDSLKKKINYRVGNDLAHENPFVLSFNIIFYRWHNLLASTLCNPEKMKKNKNLTDQYCYNEAKKWVTATLQHIIVDEWLPAFLGEPLDSYTLYDPSIDPTISNAFQSAAMRFGHTLVPIGVYKMVGSKTCETDVIRVCDSYYNSAEIVQGIDSLILGMVNQAAEKGDPLLVSDLRRYLHGPSEITRQDLMAMNIQRGRDHGLPGFEVAHKLLIQGNHSFHDEVPFNPAYSEIITKLKKYYKSLENIDLWVGGLLESDDGIGPVFKAIVKDQFRRIRDGDRFWFQNIENGLFTASQIEMIQRISMKDLLLYVLDDVDKKDFQDNVFYLPFGPESNNLTCIDQLNSLKCNIEELETICYALPPLVEEGVDCSTATTVSACHKWKPQTYDHFTGSGPLFVLSFLFLFLFVLGCGITLIVLVKQRHKASERKRQSVKRLKKDQSDDKSCLVTEWIGRTEGTREVVVHFNIEKKQLAVSLLSKQTLRSIDLKRIQMIELQVSTDGNPHCILIRIAREYDIVLNFENDEEKDNFIQKLEDFLGTVGIGRQRYEMNKAHMLKCAFTKADRQTQLEKFFRVVFAQAFSIHQDQNEHLDLDGMHVKEIVNVELTAYEFAEALSLRPEALFVSQMFALIDADGNGYISFREFLDVIIIFAKGTPEDKTKLMFDMYDIGHSGKLTRLDFSSMIRSLLELANQSLSSEQLDRLISSMFKSAGLQNKQELTFEDFTHLLADHRDELGYVQLSFDVGAGYKAAPQVTRNSIAGRAQDTVLRAYSIIGDQSVNKSERGKSYIKIETKPQVYEVDLTKQQVNRFVRLIENYHLHIFWVSLYTLVIFGIFIDKAFYYSVEAEHTGLRRIAGFGLTITRGAASAMMFAYSTILLTMCRNTITLLRETFLHKYFPFDAAISFHKYIAFWGLFFSVFHAIGHGINFYHISTQPFNDLQCILSNFHLDSCNPPKFYNWLFQTITGMTGVFLVMILSLMYIFAIQFSRRHVFNAFWKTHNLYPILYILMILHGAGGLIQEPIFYYYFLGPCVLFAVDKLVCVSRKKVEISVIKAELLPSGVTHLEFTRPANFEYRSGQWVRIACVPLNTNEYHPFTLSSAPHEENLSLHIRAVGPWTSNLRNVYDPNNLQQHAYPKIYLDGPYGEGHQDWFRYDVSVLVGGGIGITPFASILKDVVFKSSMRNKIFCKKLYFIWVTRSQKQFEWMIDIIREVEESDKSGLVDVHIFITQFFQKFDLRTTMLYICERHFQRVCGKSLFTGLRSTTHFGRPDFQVFLDSLREEHSDVGKIAVFSCGPPLMTHNVQLSCEELNKSEGAIFVHHFENF